MRHAVMGGALVLLLTVPPGAPAASETAENPFDGARRAEHQLSFVGFVDVTWEDARGPQAEHLEVRGADGTISIQGRSTVMADPEGATMVRRPEGDWDLLWAGPPTSAGRPDLHEKYDLTDVVQPVPALVASRPTRLIEVRQGPLVRERLFVDDASGLLLRREQLGLDGRPVRSVAFSSIQVDAGIPPPSTPARLADRSPDRVSTVSAPAVLPDGFRRVDAYREKGAVRVLYSDGLYDMSLFTQRGALSGRDVPAAGTRVKVGPADGWVYAWAGGQVLVWHRGHTVYSLVSEAPVDELLTAARALPAAGGTSVLTRLRRVCRTLVQPLAP